MKARKAVCFSLRLEVRFAGFNETGPMKARKAFGGLRLNQPLHASMRPGR